MSHCRAKAKVNVKNLCFMLDEDIQELARKREKREKEGGGLFCLSFVFQKTRSTSCEHKSRN